MRTEEPPRRRWKRWFTEQKIPGPTREGEPVMVEVLTNLSVDNKKGWVYEEWTSLVNQRWKRWRTDQMFPVREGEPAMMEALTNLLVDYNKGHVWEEWTTLPA